jgi:cytochrome c oxidase subunit IV
MAELGHTATGHGTSPAGHGPHSHGDHASNLHTFRMVFVGLLVATAVSVATAQWLPAPPQVVWAIMMAVSCVKAMLVISFFMHLLWEANWKYILTIPATLMSVLLVLLLVPDIGRRTKYYSEERWRHASHPTEVRHNGTHHEESGQDHDEVSMSAITDD